jgi:hypothetical protein
MVRKDQEAARVDALYMPFCGLIKAAERGDTSSVVGVTKGAYLRRARLFVLRGQPCSSYWRADLLCPNVTLFVIFCLALMVAPPKFAYQSRQSVGRY